MKPRITKREGNPYVLGQTGSTNLSFLSSTLRFIITYSLFHSFSLSLCLDTLIPFTQTTFIPNFRHQPETISEGKSAQQEKLITKIALRKHAWKDNEIDQLPHFYSTVKNIFFFIRFWFWLVGAKNVILIFITPKHTSFLSSSVEFHWFEPTECHWKLVKFHWFGFRECF